jgi:hypothetical protein
VPVEGGRNQSAAEVLRLEGDRSGGPDGLEGAIVGGGADARATLGGTDLSPARWLPGTVVPAF